MSLSGLNHYRSMGAQGALADATPHQVVQVMFDAVLSRIAEAVGHLERGETAAKGEKVSKALAIIEALTLGLDTSKGGEIASNLERLYDYMSRTLVRANAENRRELFAEVSALVREIKQGWDGIAATARA